MLLISVTGERHITVLNTQTDVIANFFLISSSKARISYVVKFLEKSQFRLCLAPNTIRDSLSADYKSDSLSLSDFVGFSAVSWASLIFLGNSQGRERTRKFRFLRSLVRASSLAQIES